MQNLTYYPQPLSSSRSRINILLESSFHFILHSNLHSSLSSLETDGMMGSGGIVVLALTLHIYPDGLDGSHPNPVLGLAVVAASLHPLDVVDA